MAKICKNCGEKLFPNDTFCGFCGADVVGEPLVSYEEALKSYEEAVEASAASETSEISETISEAEGSEATSEPTISEAEFGEATNDAEISEATSDELTAEEELAIAQAELLAAEAELAAIEAEAGLDGLSVDVSELNMLEGILPIEATSEEADLAGADLDSADLDSADLAGTEMAIEQGIEEADGIEEAEDVAKEDSVEGFLEDLFDDDELNEVNDRWEMAQAKASELQKKEDALKRRAMIENQSKHLGRDIALLIIGIIILIGIFIYIAKDDLKDVVGNDTHNKPAAITSVIDGGDILKDL